MKMNEGEIHEFICFDKDNTDDDKGGSNGITSEWGCSFYTESDDCVHFIIQNDHKAYSWQVSWKDSTKIQQGNMERPWLLFDDAGNPAYLFCASGKGPNPYRFQGETFIVAQEMREV